MFKILRKNFLNNKSILITGGTGSLGNELTYFFLKNYNLRKIIIFSRDEIKQSEHEKRFKKLDKKNILRYFLGDVRDLDRLNFAMQGVDIVIHTAALKHVDQAEYNPYEFINTNINGAKNIIHASLENDVEKVIALSTDKAVNPINLYGATKLASDKLFVSANNLAGNNKTRFAVVRYGNVINSRGSVAPFFLELRNNFSKFIPITHKKMTRFSITLQQSVEFILSSLNEMRGGEIFVPKIPSIRIVDLARTIAPNIPVKIVGIRPGEKIKEVLCSSDEFFNVIEFKNYFLIKPSVKFIDSNIDFQINKNKEKGKKVKEGFEYNSENNHFLNLSGIKKLLSDAFAK
jgi:UDP-N-acetylglucosamine 4,6-dehydratase